MSSNLLIRLAFPVCAGCLIPARPTETDLDRLQGNWVVVSVWKGNDLRFLRENREGATIVMTFADQKLTRTTLTPEGPVDPALVATFEVDQTKDPKWIDCKPIAKELGTMAARGIYHFRSDTVLLLSLRQSDITKTWNRDKPELDFRYEPRPEAWYGNDITTYVLEREEQQRKKRASQSRCDETVSV